MPANTKFDPKGINKAIEHMNKALSALTGSSCQNTASATTIVQAVSSLIDGGGMQMDQYYGKRATAVSNAVIQSSGPGAQNVIAMLQNTLTQYGYNEDAQGANADATGQGMGGEG